MELQNFLHALEHIETDICQVIGAMKATILKTGQSSRTDESTTSKQMSAVLPECETMKKYKNKTISRRPDGRYWTRYYDKNGKQRSVYGKSVNECLTKLKEALKQNENKKAISGATTLGEWLNKWMDLYKVKNLKPNTLEQMNRSLPCFAPIGKIPLKKLTAIDIQEFLNSIEQPRKREKLHMMLKDALTKAEKNGIIENNLFDAITLPKRIKKKSTALTDEQEAEFIKACQSSNQGDLLQVCLYQGLRLGEALALEYSDVDMKRRTIKVTKAIDTLGNVTTPKTETSIRTIPMFERTFQLLAGRSGKGRIFTYPRKVYQNAMRRIVNRLGFDGVSIHTLRHTFATRCAEIGISAKVTQVWLGHSTVDMTMNVYTHVTKEMEQNMTNKMNVYFDTHIDT